MIRCACDKIKITCNFWVECFAYGLFFVDHGRVLRNSLRFHLLSLCTVKHLIKKSKKFKLSWKTFYFLIKSTDSELHFGLCPSHVTCVHISTSNLNKDHYIFRQVRNRWCTLLFLGYYAEKDHKRCFASYLAHCRLVNIHVKMKWKWSLVSYTVK